MNALHGYFTGPTVTDWHGAVLATVVRATDGPVRYTPTGGRYRITTVVARDTDGRQWIGKGSFDWSQLITLKRT